VGFQGIISHIISSVKHFAKAEVVYFLITLCYHVVRKQREEVGGAEKTVFSAVGENNKCIRGVKK
jgi:hypothetical protein